MAINVKNAIIKEGRKMYKLCLMDITLIMAICLAYYILGI